MIATLSDYNQKRQYENTLNELNSEGYKLDAHIRELDVAIRELRGLGSVRPG